VWDVIYSPFGGVSYIWGPETMDIRFPGQWFQLESGLAYNWHRHYDATLGRYVQPDPIGLKGGRSLYSYVGGSPLVYVDTVGLETNVIITRDSGWGSHAAIFIDRNGSNFLYDSSGSYHPPKKCGCELGSSRIGTNIEQIAMTDYVRYHRNAGSSVEIYRFNTSSEEEAEIMNRADEQGGGLGFSCAADTSSVLSGIGPFKSLRTTWFPGNLANQLKSTPGLLGVGGPYGPLR